MKKSLLSRIVTATRLVVMFVALLPELTWLRFICNTKVRRPLSNQPDWVVGMLITLYKNVSHPEPRNTYLAAVAEQAMREAERATALKMGISSPAP